MSEGLTARLRWWFRRETHIDVEEIRAWKQRSLNYILYLTLSFALLNAAVAALIYGRFSQVHSYVVVVIPIIGILLNRRGMLGTAAFVAVLLPTISSIVHVVQTGVAHIAIFLIWGLFVSAIVFSLRLTIALVLADIACLLLIALVSPRFTILPGDWDITRPDYFSTSIVFLAVTGMAITFCYDYLMHLYREVREARQDLERKVELRTKQIRSYQEQLMQAQKMESIGRLAAGVAHDFNNILTAVLGNASIGRLKGEDTREAVRLFAGIESAALKGKELTGKLLGFSRQGQYEIEALDINEVVQEVVGILARTTRREVAVNCTLSDPIYVKCDRVQIEQSLLNICINARDAIEGTGNIDIGVQTEELRSEDVPDLPDGTYARIAVADSGKGMDGETRSRIFEPFFTTKEKGKGTGLGLSMTYGIVRNHGGSIHVESAPGGGSTFAIRLPITEERAETRERTTDAPVVSRKATVLVVDDEPEVCSITADMLRMLGYEVLQTNSGRESIEMFRLRRADVDIVLLDFSMPEMPGPLVFEKLREVDPSVKVVVFSGYGLDREVQALLAGGASGFIRKPFTIRMLSEKIEEILA